MAERAAKSARIASVIAATGIALACGTNYAYSAWGPDFARRLHLNATEANIIGAAGNVGSYAMGVPAGILIDTRGPRIAVLFGAACLAAGYFPIHTGAYNWPHKRGTATAFALSGFGLSAFFFTTLGHLFLGESTSDFLLLLAAGTLVLNLSAVFFLRLIPSTATTYLPVRTDDLSAPSTKLRKRSDSLADPADFERTSLGVKKRLISGIDGAADEHTGLTSRASTTDEFARDDFKLHGPQEITGVALLSKPEFWQQFVMLGLLAGVGLMTINNIGNDADALWHAYMPDVDPNFIHRREKMHVALLSLMSCVGRFLSGIGSDVLVTRLHASRYWCLFVSACIFTVAQVFALLVSNPNKLFLVSGLTGIAYGALFGVFPALVADAFGVSGLSMNWGFIIFAPVITGNIYNVIYGRILDANSPRGEGYDGECHLGLGCYVAAYWLTLATSVVGCFGAVWCVRSERLRKDAIGRTGPV